MSANFEVTPEQKGIVGALLTSVELAANDLTNLFKNELKDHVDNGYIDIMNDVANGKPIGDSKLKQLADAADAAWKLFRKLDSLYGNVEVKYDNKVIYEYTYRKYTEPYSLRTWRGTEKGWHEHATPDYQVVTRWSVRCDH